MAEFSFEELDKMYQPSSKQSVEFFSLKNDGDEAIVRFAFDNLSELQYATVHNVTVGGRYRKASCTRKSLSEPVESCPLCAAGNPLQQRMFVKLIQYNLDERDVNGRPSYVAKIWERSVNFRKILGSFINNYGPLSDMVFKIVRRGASGDTKTTYDILPCMPQVYNPELYVKDFSAFDDYSVFGTVVIDEDYVGLTQILNGTWQPKRAATTNTVSAATTTVGNVTATIQTDTLPTWQYTPTQTEVVTKPKRTYNY